MKAVVYRPNQLDRRGSRRPRSLVDMRGAIFPDEYHEILVFDTESITQAFDQYPSEWGMSFSWEKARNWKRMLQPRLVGKS